MQLRYFRLVTNTFNSRFLRKIADASYFVADGLYGVRSQKKKGFPLHVGIPKHWRNIARLRNEAEDHSSNPLPKF